MPIQLETSPVILHLPATLTMSDEQFYEFCRANKDLRIERTAGGEIVVMAPAGGKTSNRNLKLAVQLGSWTAKDGTGEAFDSSAGFKLPNGATRGPDASWVRRDRLASLTTEQKDRFLPLCPDFVVELRSPTDSLEMLRAKMNEYIANGARLGWLIDAERRRVQIYRPNEPVETLEGPSELNGDPVLSGFILSLAAIWAPSL